MKKVVFLIDGFKLDGNDVHLKLFSGIARWVERDADVHICVTNCRPCGISRGKSKKEIQDLIYKELGHIYGGTELYFSVEVLFDSGADEVNPHQLFIRLHEQYGVIDMLIVASGYWRPQQVELLFIRLSKTTYFYKMGLHNANNNLSGYDAIMSPHPELEKVPPEFAGNLILRPTTYAFIGDIDASAEGMSPADKELCCILKQLKKTKVLVSATKKFTTRLESKFYWLVDQVYKAYDGDVALLLAGEDADQGRILVKNNCSTPVVVESFPFQQDLPRFFQLIRKNCQCIYIHPDCSGGGHCKVLAALIMPTFIFSPTDSVQMHPVSLCSCKEEVLYKCLSTFDDYGDSVDIVRRNKEYEVSFLRYSRWLLQYLLETAGE